MKRISKQPDFKRSKRLSDQIADFILEQIKTGFYREGEIIESETNLATQFGVSRTVIREALARLKYNGILKSKQGSGVQVWNMHNSKSFELDLRHNSKSNDILALYELRAVLEGDTTALAAERRTDEHVKALRRCLDEMMASVERNEDYSQSDAKFHQIVAGASGNIYLRDFLNFLSENLRKLCHSAILQYIGHPTVPKQAYKEHKAIFDAIAEGDIEAARKASICHLKNALSRQKIPKAKSHIFNTLYK